MQPRNPKWLYEGQEVYVRARLVDPSLPSTTGLKCTVIIAAGDAGRVRNERWGFDSWMSIWDLWLKPEKQTA